MVKLQKEARLNLRTTQYHKDVISKAAAIKQTTTSEFILKKAYEAACEVLSEQNTFLLSEKQWREFCRALDATPKDILALKKLLTEPGVFDE